MTDPAFARQVLADVRTLTLTTVGPILADGDAPCFADGPVGIKRATLLLLATLAPERWNACSLAVFDQDRSVVITADDAPPIQPAEEYRHRFDTVTLAAPEAPVRIWRADVARLARPARRRRRPAPALPNDRRPRQPPAPAADGRRNRFGAGSAFLICLKRLPLLTPLPAGWRGCRWFCRFVDVGPYDTIPESGVWGALA